MTLLRALPFLATCIVIAGRSWTSNWFDVGLWLGLYAVQFGLMLWQYHRGPEQGRMALATGLLFRTALLAAGWNFGQGQWERFLVYDHDVWRYLWDGHVSAAGLSPYANAPSDPALDHLADEEPWDSVRLFLNYPDFRTVYPPGAQWLFRLLDGVLPGSPLGPKLTALAADLAIIALLPGRWRWLYAWNPLALKAGAASGHVDSVLGLLVLAAARAIGSPVTAGGWLGLAILFKWSPAVLLPWLWQRAGVRAALTAIAVVSLGWLPSRANWPEAAAALAAFGSTWQFNAPLLTGLAALPGIGPFARPILTVILAAVLATLLGKRRWTAGSQAAWLIAALVLLSPAVMPWYLLWALPVGLWARQWGPLLFTAPAALAMHVMVSGQERGWWLAVEGIALLAVGAITFPRRAANARLSEEI